MKKKRCVSCNGTLDMEYSDLCSDCYGIPRYVYDYHCSYLSNRVRDSNGLNMGIEFEMYSGDFAVTAYYEDCDEPETTVEMRDFMYEFYMKFGRKDGSGHNVTFEKDGSLSYEEGVEMITSPHTLRFYKHDRWLEDMLRFVIDEGFSAYNIPNCGLHIHISKTDNDKFDLQTALAFMKLNSEIMYYVAGREINCEYSASLNSVSFCRSGMDINRINSHYNNIYSTDKGTYEFRIFQGNLKYSTVIRHLEFVESFYRFMSSPAKSIWWSDYVSWLVSNKKLVRKYNNLVSFIKDRYFGIDKGGTLCVEF